MSRTILKNVAGKGKNSLKNSRGLIPFAHLDYSKQLNLKQSKINGILRLLVNKLKDFNSSILPDESGLPCLLEKIEPSPVTKGYRNTDDFSIWPGRDGNPKTVGYILGKFDEFNQPICASPDEFSIVKGSHQKLAVQFQQYLRECSPLDVCLDFSKGGHWRRFTVRSNDFDELMGVAILHPQNLLPNQLTEEHNRLVSFFSSIPSSVNLKSLYFQACPGVRCSHARAPFKLLLGNDHIDEVINGVKIRITPEPFLQINKGAAEILYKRIIEEIEPEPNMTILDMCCGSGILAMQVAPLVKEVVGIDSCEQSINDAKINAQVNNITNCKFIHGTIEDHLMKLSEDLYSDNLVMIINPGSGGLLSGVVNVIRMMSNVSKLIYVSCKPEGQALKNFAHLCLPFRPMDDIQGDAFIPVKAIPVDLFPQTDRCELIISSAAMAGYLGRVRNQMYDRIIRVNHAGELGADRIYFGQMLALRRRYPEKAAVIQKMWDQEKEHLNKFEYLAGKHRARKSALVPIWQIGAFGLGFVPALLGPQAAMAVTEAVEKVIVQHYDSQLRELMADDPTANEDMIKTISQFRDDEQHHHDCALEHDAKLAPGYQLLSKAVENICKVAVKVAEKI